MFVHVAVPVPTLDLLTYRIPPGTPMPAVGARVVVPIGTRAVTGVVVAIDVSASGVNVADVKAIRNVLDREPFVPADVVDLARWTAEYYGAGAGETITAVLPPKTRGERADSHKSRRVAVLTAAGMDGLEGGTTKQRDALSLIGGSANGVSTAELVGERLQRRHVEPAGATRADQFPPGDDRPRPVRIERAVVDWTLNTGRQLTVDQEVGAQAPDQARPPLARFAPPCFTA